MNILLLTRKQSFFMIALNLIWQTLYPIDLPRKAHWQKIAPEKYTILFSGPDTQQIISVKHNQKEILIGNTEQFLPTMNGMLEKLKQPESNIIVYKAFPAPRSKTSFWSLRKLFSPKYINETVIDQATKNPTTMNNFENICIQAIYNFFRPNPLQSNSTRSKEKQRTLKILERMTSNNNLAKTIYAMLFPAKPTSNKTRPIATTSNNPTDAVRRLISPTLEEREASLSRIAADQAAAKERNKQRSASFTQTVLLQDAIKELNDISNNADIEFESILNKEAANRQAIQAREELLHREETERKSLSEQGLTLPNEVVALKEKAAEIEDQNRLLAFTQLLNDETQERININNERNIEISDTMIEHYHDTTQQGQAEDQFQQTPITTHLNQAIENIKERSIRADSLAAKAEAELKEESARWRANIAQLRALKFGVKLATQKGKSAPSRKGAIETPENQLQMQQDLAYAQFELFELGRQKRSLLAKLKDAEKRLTTLIYNKATLIGIEASESKILNAEKLITQQNTIIKAIENEIDNANRNLPSLEAKLKKQQAELTLWHQKRIDQSLSKQNAQEAAATAKLEKQLNVTLKLIKKAEKLTNQAADKLQKAVQEASLMHEKLQQALSLKNNLSDQKAATKHQQAIINETQAQIAQILAMVPATEDHMLTEKQPSLQALEQKLLENKAILTGLSLQKKEILAKIKEFLHASEL